MLRRLLGRFHHPRIIRPPVAAKYSRFLIERIFDHMLAKGWIRKGDVVGDCFGGIATGGIVAAYRGLQWVGVELEPRFVGFAQRNIALHASRLKAFDRPLPRIVQGDSRNFAQIVGEIVATVTSPPYAETAPEAHGPGIGGSVDAVTTSPPYGESLDHGGGPDTRQDLIQGGKSLMRIKEGYGNSTGQISGSGETYWQAMLQVYTQCFLAIKPGGYLCVVVKDYCQKGKRVRLCDDTLRLLEHIGFTPVERVHAMLTKTQVEAGLFEDIKTTKSKKSFFRRLCENKIPEGDERRIDHEEVLFVRKPLTNFPQD